MTETRDRRRRRCQRPYACQWDANWAVLDAAARGQRLTTERCEHCGYIHVVADTGEETA